MTGILWDLDGTLLDTLEDLHLAVNHALARFGCPLRTREEVRTFVGNGARKLMERSAPEGADTDVMLAAFHEYYDVHCQDNTRPYDGISEALAALKKKYPMAIVSNKPHVAVATLCERYFPGIYALGERAGCPRKPAPDMVFRAMQAIGADRCIYVGDSEVDVLTARNAGVPCLSILWGFRDREELEGSGAEHFCGKTEEIADILEELIHGK